MSLRIGEKDWLALQQRRGPKVSSPPAIPPARSGGDSGHSITVVLVGEPRGKGRPRFTRTGRPYTPAKTRAYERAVALAGKVAIRGRKLLDGSLMVTVTAVMGVPRSWSTRRRDAALAGTVRPTGKPDWDNIAKVLDALNGVVWTDDAAIVDGRVVKFYGDEPMLQVEVKVIGAFDAGTAESASA